MELDIFFLKEKLLTDFPSLNHHEFEGEYYTSVGTKTLVLVQQPTKVFISHLFTKESVKSFYCDICQFVKHHRATFLPSNNKSVDFFDLVHSYVWGPITTFIYRAFILCVNCTSVVNSGRSGRYRAGAGRSCDGGDIASQIGVAAVAAERSGRDSAKSRRSGRYAAVLFLQGFLKFKIFLIFYVSRSAFSLLHSAFYVFPPAQFSGDILRGYPAIRYPAIPVPGLAAPLRYPGLTTMRVPLKFPKLFLLPWHLLHGLPAHKFGVKRLPLNQTASCSRAYDISPLGPPSGATVAFILETTGTKSSLTCNNVGTTLMKHKQVNLHILYMQTTIGKVKLQRPTAICKASAAFSTAIHLIALESNLPQWDCKNGQKQHTQTHGRLNNKRRMKERQDEHGGHRVGIEKVGVGWCQIQQEG
ncbi:hypothetical protein CR513_00752, partial [Mucuna pruriens]